MLEHEDFNAKEDSQGQEINLNEILSHGTSSDQRARVLEKIKRNLDLWAGSVAARGPFEESAFSYSVGQDSIASSPYTVSNRIANTVNMKLSILGEYPLRASIMPRKVSGAAFYYFRKNFKASLTLEAIDQFAQIGTMHGVEAAQANAMLEGMLEVPKGVMDMARANGIVQDETDDIIVLNEDFACEALTKELESQVEKSEFMNVLSHSNRMKLIGGFSDTEVSWNPKNSQIEFKSHSPWNITIDPAAIDLKSAGYVITRDYISRHEALCLYPELKSVDKFKDTTHEIIESGLEFEGDRVSGEVLFPNDMRLLSALRESANNQTQSTTNSSPCRFSSGNVERITFWIKDYKLIEGEETERKYPEQIIRKVTVVGETIVEDIDVEEVTTFPIVRNINIPIPDSQFGIGDPEYLEQIQSWLDVLYSMVWQHSMRFKTPVIVVANSDYEENPASYEGLGRRYGGIVKVSESAFAGGVVPFQFVNPPDLPPIIYNMIEHHTQEIDILAGTNRILRGGATGEMSGKLFDTAYNISKTSVLDLTYKNTVKFVEKISRIAVKILIHNLDPIEWHERHLDWSPVILEKCKEIISKIIDDVIISVTPMGDDRADLERMTEVAQTNPAMFQSKTFAESFLEKSHIPKADQAAEEMAAAMAAAQQAPTK